MRLRRTLAISAELAALAVLVSSCSPSSGDSGGAGGSGGEPADSAVDAIEAATDARADVVDGDAADAASDAASDAADAADAIEEPECAQPSDCPAAADECKKAACVAGKCSIGNAPDGTAIAAQNAGDCFKVVCDGQGGTKSVSDPDDVIADDNECTDDACVNGAPSHPPSAPNHACTANGGRFCDGSGACVDCTEPSQCTSGVCTGAACQPPRCDDGVKNGAETDVDCGGPAGSADSCPRCGVGKTCGAKTDCALPYCPNGACEQACGLVCGAACVATCGNGTCDPGESCTSCAGDCPCTSGTCGDGVIDAGEACDDGNQRDDDFCSNSCAVQDVQASALAAATSRFGALAPVGDGTFVAAWGAYANVSAGVEARHRRFTESGAGIDAQEAQANAAASGDQVPVAVANVHDGTFDVAWTLSSGFIKVQGRRFENSCGGTIALSPADDSFMQAAAFAPTSVDAVAATTLLNGSLVVAWSSRSIASLDPDVGAYFWRFNPGGGKLDAGAVSATTTLIGDQTVRSIAALANGGFVVAWTDATADGSGTGVFARTFDANGTATSSEIALATFTAGDQYGPVVSATPSGGFVAAWTGPSIATIAASISAAPLGVPVADRDAFVRRFDEAGSPLDAAEQVANVGASGYQEAATIATNADGTTLVVWNDGAGCYSSCTNDDVAGRLFAADGTPIGSDAPMSLSQSGYQGFPRAAALPSGAFVVGFTSSADPTNTNASQYLHLVPKP